MQGAVVERNHVARLDRERNDLVPVTLAVNVGDEFEAAGVGNVRDMVDELAWHESAAPTV